MLHRNAISKYFKFESLTSERRSPFFGVDPNLMFSFFESLGALEEVTAKKRSAIEGCILFRQAEPQKNVHILVSGAIVFFQDNCGYNREVGDPVAVGRTGDRKTWNIQDSSCCGIIRAGQIAGMHEILLSHILSDTHSDRDSMDSFELKRREALRNSSLPALSGKWLHSGYLATNSTVISVDVQIFRKALSSNLIDTHLTAAKGQPGDTNFTTEKFIRRCEEDSMFRNARYLHDKALITATKHDVRLAHIWYEYYLRTPEEIKQRFENSDKRYMCQVKVDQLAWLLDVKPGEVKSASDKLIEIGILQRVSSKGEVLITSADTGQHARTSYFNFDPRALKDYYLLNGDATALKKKYGGKYSLQPLEQGETI